MPLDLGNTSTSFYGIAINEGRLLSSYTIVNKSLGVVTANLAIRRNNSDFDIIPKNTTIQPNEMYPYGQLPIPIEMNAGDGVVLIVTGGNVDYSLSYERAK